MTDYIRMNKDKTTSLIRQGEPLSLTGSGTTDLPFINESGGAVYYLYVHSVASGDVTFSVNVEIAEYSAPVQTLSTISAASSELTIVKVPISPSQGYVSVSHTDDCTVSVWAQAIDPTSDRDTLASTGVSEDAQVDEVALPAGSWTAVTTMDGVRQINIQNKSGADVKVNWISPTQGSLPVGFVGPTIVDNQERLYSLDPAKDVVLYARCESAVTVIVEQLK